MKKSVWVKGIPLAAILLTLTLVPLRNYRAEAVTRAGESFVSESAVTKTETKKQSTSATVSAEQVTITVRTPDGKPVEDLFVLFYPHMQTTEKTNVIDREIMGFTNKEGICTLSFKESKVKLLPGDTVTIIMGNTQIQKGSFKEQTVGIPFNSHPKFSLIWKEEMPAEKPVQGQNDVLFKVIDETGKPIEDLKITFRERDKVVPAGEEVVPSKINKHLLRIIGLTDENGEYIFVEMPKTTYRVSVEKEGKLKMYDVDITGKEQQPIQLVWGDFE